MLIELQVLGCQSWQPNSSTLHKPEPGTRRQQPRIRSFLDSLISDLQLNQFPGKTSRCQSLLDQCLGNCSQTVSLLDHHSLVEGVDIHRIADDHPERQFEELHQGILLRETQGRQRIWLRPEMFDCMPEVSGLDGNSLRILSRSGPIESTGKNRTNQICEDIISPGASGSVSVSAPVVVIPSKIAGRLSLGEISSGQQCLFIGRIPLAKERK